MKLRPILLASAATATLLVAGCSDDADENDIVDTPTTAGQSDSATEQGATQEGSNSVEAPIIIDGADSISTTVGMALDVVTPNVSRAETDDDSVLDVSQPNSDGSAEFNAGATVVGAGEATLSVYQDDELLYEVQVSAEG